MHKLTDRAVAMRKRITKIIIDIILILFLALCAVALFLALFSKRDADGAVNMFGMQMRIVVSPSMEENAETDVSDYQIKSIPVRSMVFVQLVPEEEDKAAEWYASLRAGDVLTFRYVYGRQVTITHRITSVTPKADGYVIELQGDNHADETGALTQTVDTTESDSPNYIIGKVTGQSVVLGNVLYIVKQPVGMALIVIVPCSLIIVWEIIRVVGVFGAEKKQKQAEEKRRKDEELDRLRRELEELKGVDVTDKNNPKEEKAILDETATDT